MSQFTVIHLQADRFDEAFPLVRMSAPNASLDQWRHFAGQLRTKDGGVLAALACDGRPHGLAVFRMEDGLGQGRTLKVEPMVTFELNRSAPVRSALCQALELLAGARGCETLVIAATSRGYANPNGSKAAAWAEFGLELTSVILTKRLIPAPATDLASL